MIGEKVRDLEPEGSFDHFVRLLHSRRQRGDLVYVPRHSDILPY